MEKRWNYRQAISSREESLSAALDIGGLLARVLVARGFSDPTSARNFLQPRLTHLYEPDTLPDIERAADRILQAISCREKTVIYGDYDADGISATVLLLQFLKLAGANVEYYLPHRLEEGYGLNGKALEKIRRDGAKLVITVDCGVTSAAEAELARSLGMDLVITDHHEPRGPIPRCIGVVNPKVQGSSYPFAHLAGAGVAFKVAWAILKKLSPRSASRQGLRDFLTEALGMVALGTISDVVPLVDENRVLSRCGLEILSKSRSPGLRALIRVSRLEGRPIRAHDVAYRLGPRLNAAGRMGTADVCVELLTTERPEKAEELAGFLEENNRQRQKTQNEVLEEVYEKIRQEVDLDKDYCIVLDGPWHRGVLGIVAGKVAEEFHRPTVILNNVGSVGHGSARSIPHVHLMEALSLVTCSPSRFGGHAQAAGLEIPCERIKDFRDDLNRVLRGLLSAGDLETSLEIDAEVELADLTAENVKQILFLEPTGEGNPAPIFVAKGLALAGEPRRMGPTLKHLNFFARQSRQCLRAVVFGKPEVIQVIESRPKNSFDLAFRPTLSSWAGESQVELVVEDVHTTQA